ncbi:MAG: DUF3054 domain-containing protein [Knoellia sp.]
MSRLIAPLLDLLAVVVFAIVGRRSHAHGITFVGVLETAAPFLCGTAAGYLVAAMTVGTPRSWQFGAIVVVATVVIGMLFRRLAAVGTAPTFIVVATVFLAVTMLGWRFLANLTSH